MLLWLRRVSVPLAALIGGVALLWSGLLVLAAAILMLVAALISAISTANGARFQRFRTVWRSEGKDLLLEYSNSPHWQRYVEETWLPRWGHRAVVLNWSERSKWGSSAPAEVALFRAFAGGDEFNPLGIVVPPTGRQVHIVSFLARVPGIQAW
jgi:hypothetical protein